MAHDLQRDPSPRFATRLSRRLAARCRSFVGGSRGSASVELVITLPLLLWALAASVVFYNGYQARYHAQMAAQTVADIMSRETDLFTANYVEGLNDVYDFLADSRYPTRLRVTSVIWDSTNERNRLQWSYGTRDLAGLPEDTFALMQAGDMETLLAEFGDDTSATFAGAAAQMPITDLPDHIPPVLPGEALLVVEAFSLWEPFASVGLGQLRFTPVVVVRPRFAPWINFEGVEPVYPEADYETAWTGSGNDSLPDPTDPVEPPDDDSTTTTYSFESTEATGFSSTTRTAGGPSGYYLGPFGSETYNTPINLSVTLAAANANATIEFDLLIIDTWDGMDVNWSPSWGDNFTLLYNGTPLALDLFDNDLNALYGNNRISGGYIDAVTYGVTMTRTSGGSNVAGAYYNDSVWHVTLTLNNAPQDFTLGFSASVTETLSNESFGIDNVTIASSGTGTAPPFTANSADLLSADPHTRFPRYSGCPEYRISAPWLTMTRSDLTSGITMQRRAYGTNSMYNCGLVSGSVGYAISSPALVLNYDNQNSTSSTTALQITMNDNNRGYSCDTTLIIRDPNGQWYFNDDYSGYNAGLRITAAASGQYVIFIGTYSRTNCNSYLTVNQWSYSHH